jgi:antitoxin component YwqK of YwqJK toxin-antitoxin module
MTTVLNHINPLVSFSLLFFFSCNGEPANRVEERIERFDNGSISRTVSIVNGKKEGKMTDFYPDGKLMAERWFRQGKQEGRTVIFYPFGAIKEVQYFKDGAQQGGDTLWYESGKIQFTVFFNQNKKDGYLRKWSPEGTIIFESRYAMDTLMEVKGEAISRQSIRERSLSDTLIRLKDQK